MARLTAVGTTPQPPARSCWRVTAGKTPASRAALPTAQLMDKLCPHLTHCPVSECLCPPHKLCPPTPSPSGPSFCLHLFCYHKCPSLLLRWLCLSLVTGSPIATACCCSWNKQSISATQGQSGGWDIHSVQRPYLTLQFLERSIRRRI